MEGLGVTALAVRLDFARSFTPPVKIPIERLGRYFSCFTVALPQIQLERTYQTIAAMTTRTSRPLPKDKCGP
jgi:hypothetical protein